jgi:hypothetical protein
MKYLFIASLIFLISSCSLNNETYICDVLELANISAEDEENFGVKNGSIKGTENEFSIRISVNPDKLDFKNLGNGSKMSMKRESYGEDKSKIFANGGYIFELFDNGKFTFSVNKANYHADYLGECSVNN